MGKQTPDKNVFDELARKLFTSKGYRAAVLSGQTADVAAWHPGRKEFAIIEVKSPWETDADINFRYKENYDLKNKSRKEIWEAIKQESFVARCPCIARLITFTVSNQLCTYWNKREKHIEKFCRLTRTKQDINPRRSTAFLVLPADRVQMARRVLHFLSRRIGGIRKFSVSTHRKLCVVAIDYSSWNH